MPAGRRAGLGIKWVPRIMTTRSHSACWTPAYVVGATTKVGGVAVARSSDAAIGEHLLNVLPQPPSLADPPRHAAVFYIDEEDLPNHPETGPDEHERRDERTLTSPG